MYVQSGTLDLDQNGQNIHRFLPNFVVFFILYINQINFSLGCHKSYFYNVHFNIIPKYIKGIREVLCLAQLTCITILVIIEIHVLTTCFNPLGVIFRLTLLWLISNTTSG